MRLRSKDFYATQNEQVRLDAFEGFSGSFLGYLCFWSGCSRFYGFGMGVLECLTVFERVF